MKRIQIFFFILLAGGFNKTLYAQKTPESLGWKLCVQSFSFFPHYTLEESLKRADSLGLKYMEIFPFQEIGGGIKGKTYHTMDKQTREAILQMAAEHGIKIISYGVINFKYKEWGTIYDEAEWISIFEFAKEMGIQTIIAEPTFEQLDMVEKLADKYKVNVAIHNHPKPTLYWSPEMVVKALKGRSKRMGACADIGHWVRAGLDPVKSMRQLKGRIISFHFKDLNLYGVMDAHDVVWGTGVSNIKAVIQEMKRQNFKGTVVVEYEYNKENSLPEIRESLKNFALFTMDLK